MLGIIDRIEDKSVVVELENKDILSIERNKIPIEAKEGDVLNIGNSITINLEETIKRKRYIEGLSDELWK
jgi:hypothetical protein